MENLEEIARTAVLTWQKWAQADGLDNEFWVPAADAMYDLQTALGIPDLPEEE